MSIVDETRIAFLGGMFFDIKAIERRSLGPIQYAANNLQWNLINGLESVLQRKIDLMTVPYIGSFPRRYTTPLFVGHNPSDRQDWWQHEAGFINVPGIKPLSRTVAATRSLTSWVRTTANVPKRVVLVYAAHLPFILATRLASLASQNIAICLIVPDLPLYMNPDRTGYLGQLLSHWNHTAIHGAIGHVKGFVFLTHTMNNVLNPHQRPYIVIEGMVSDQHLVEIVNTTENHSRSAKQIVYTGTLAEAYGIRLLVDAMSYIDDPDVVLYICGTGSAEAYVRSMAEKDTRITYLGQIPGEAAKKLQNQADVLVNPRTDQGDYTMYSFPSKLLEYLSTGKQVVAFKLGGIPAEYDEFLHYVPEASAAHLARTLEKALAVQPVQQKVHAESARRFVSENKTATAQAEKLVRFIESLV